MLLKRLFEALRLDQFGVEGCGLFGEARVFLPEALFDIALCRLFGRCGFGLQTLRLFDLKVGFGDFRGQRLGTRFGVDKLIGGGRR